MPKWAAANVLDQGPNYIKTNATKMHLVTAYSAADSYSTVNTNTIASSAMASGDFVLSTSGSDRVLTTASGKSGTASASTTQYDTGTATAGGASTLTDSGKSWTTNAQANRAVVITAGTGSGQHRRIASNTATVLTVTAAWGTNPDATSVYKIVDDLHIVFTDGAANVYWATDETSDGPVTSAQTVNFPQITYTSSQPV